MPINWIPMNENDRYSSDSVVFESLKLKLQSSNDFNLLHDLNLKAFQQILNKFLRLERNHSRKSRKAICRWAPKSNIITFFPKWRYFQENLRKWSRRVLFRCFKHDRCLDTNGTFIMFETPFVICT